MNVAIISVMNARNDPRGFAARTLKNLDYISNAYPNEDVHVVTQTGNSILGLIVFPFAKGLHKPHENLSLTEMENQGWPMWKQMEGLPCDTLGELPRRLRNAVAHGHWSFSNDSRDCETVRIVVLENSWKVEIGCSDLQHFCRNLTQLFES